MKKFISGVLVGLLLACTIVSAEQPIRLIVNGKDVVSDVPPQMINGRTMVPARPLAEALGATVAWDEAANAVVITSQSQPQTQPQPIVDLPEKPELPIDEALTALAREIKELGYDVQYVERDQGKHYADGHWNYVQIGIKTDQIPAEGNFDFGLSMPILKQLLPLIQGYFPDSDVWSLYVFSEIGGRFSRSVLSKPPANLGGSGYGEREPLWVFEGAATNRWSKEPPTPANTQSSEWVSTDYLMDAFGVEISVGDEVILKGAYKTVRFPTPRVSNGQVIEVMPSLNVKVDNGRLFFRVDELKAQGLFEKKLPLRINGITTRSTDWLAKDGDVFVTSSVVIDILTVKYHDAVIKFAIANDSNEGAAILNAKRYPLIPGDIVNKWQLYSLNSLAKAGLLSYQWDEQTANITVQ